MFRLGLTGGIASGKSVAAEMLGRLGAAVFDADRAVHRLLATDEATRYAVRTSFPQGWDGKNLDRRALGSIVFADAAALRRLEAILHPGVRREEERFLIRARREGVRLAVSDITLLFETDAQVRYDAVAVTLAPDFLRRRRALARPGMTEERLASIFSRQWPAARQRKHADFVIHTGLGKAYALREIKAIYLSHVKNTLGDAAPLPQAGGGAQSPRYFNILETITV